MGILKNTSSSHRLIIVNAGGKNGFVPNATLTFKSCSKSGDYNGQMNYTHFEKWSVEKLVPNIPANRIIVMDNAPYHSVQINKAPSKYTNKPDMINWLRQNKIRHSEKIRKFELAELIAQNKALEKSYKIDKIKKSKGHIVLRLPPYMCELNPIELAWAHMKRKIREKNTSTLTFP